jgi:opacity protein-like surface antigen
MRKTIMAATAVLMLALAGAAQAAVVPVPQLAAPTWEPSNSTVHSTPEGVHFGTFADAGAIGGSLTYHGLDGQPVGALAEFAYTFTYRQAGDTTGAAPYARVFLDENGDGVVDHDILLDPSNCGAVEPAQATDLTFAMSTSPVRVDDDPGNDCAASTTTFAAAKAALAGNTILGLLVTQGFSTGTDVSALLRNIVVNADTFRFDVPPAAGAPGANGTTTVVTREVQVPVFIRPVATPAPAVCSSNVRTLHAPRVRKGERLLSVKATLRDQAVRVNRSTRVMRVSLVGKPEGNYNVRITERVRTASGKVVTRRSIRPLSVVCA